MKKYEPNSFSWLAIMLTIFYIARRTQAGVLRGVDIIVCSVVVLGCILYLLNYTIKYFKKNSHNEYK
ncbi:MAG TPA: hypothetical protein DC000_12110 [Clostridiales bacterium]|nr:hypothetical protein [Clostridiales bacterium]